MTPYVLTDKADADVRSILRYTRKQWGVAQSRSYHTKLKQGMARLARGQGVSKDMSEAYPSLTMMHCEHHYIFCRPRENAPALIVAVLHERRDLLARLAERLK
jgi:plasmid stabilization system protein ParE